MAEVLRLNGRRFAPSDLIVLFASATSTAPPGNGIVADGLDLTGDIDVALRTGAGLRTTDPAAALAAGVPPETIVYDARGLPGAARLRMLVADGWPVLVNVDAAATETTAGATEAIAAASVCAWLGARVFATRHPVEVRQALDLIAAIRGDRPPKVSRRGLA